MIRSNHPLAAVLLTCAALLGAGCAAAAADAPPRHDPGVVLTDSPRLEVVGPATRTLMQGEEHEVVVRYVEADGAPIPSEAVDFTLGGDSTGATLSGRAAETDGDGLARITLRTGGNGDFTVEATAPEVEGPAVIGITVDALRFGTVDFMVDYRGMRDVQNAEVAFFTNVTCDSLRMTVPSPRDSMLARLRERKMLAGVEIGVPSALYALGIDRRDNVAAEACTDVNLTGPVATLDVVLEDVAEQTGGTFLMEEQFDVTEGFSGPVDFILEALHGLSEDPAAYLVGLVRDSDATPSWLRDALRAGLDGLATTYLRDAIDGVTVPGWLSDIAAAGADFDRALSAMTLVSELTLSEPDEFGQLEARQRLHTLRMPVASGLLENAVDGEASFAVTLTGEDLTMPEHALAVPFGEVVQIVAEETVFSRLPGSPRNFREVMDHLIDCRAVAGWFGTDGSFGVELANAACELGTTLVGSMVDDRLADLFAYDVLNLSEHTQLVDADQDYDRETFEDGTSAARWTGSAGELLFPGTLTGSRFLDETGRHHPVRDRMAELR